MTFTQEQAQIKRIIIELLNSTNRKGIHHLIGSLLASNFFSARCNSHHTYNGGLARHSLGVFELMLKNNTQADRNSLIIVGLLHDICKAKKASWHPCGLTPNGHHRHGARSVAILDHCGVELSAEEEEAICKHMHHATNSNVLWHAVRRADHGDAQLCPGSYQPYPFLNNPNESDT